MALIRAEFAAFHEAQLQFQRALREYTSILDALEVRLDGALSEWEGDAQQAYAAARASWGSSARDLRGELARLHEAIGRAHRNFRSSSSTNVQMWSA